MRLRASLVIVAAALVTLSGCSSWTSGERANPPSPLTDFVAQAEVKTVMQTSVGANGVYSFTPAISASKVFATGSDGQIKQLGSSFSIATGQQLSSGVGAGQGRIAVVTTQGSLLTYDEDGKLVWKADVGSQVLAAPTIAANTVFVRTGDGSFVGFDLFSGNKKWMVPRTQPALLLRNFAPAAVIDSVAFVGTAGGRLVAIELSKGTVLWESIIAQPRGATDLERMSDITSTPAVNADSVCAVAYQGKVACYEAKSGQLKWSRDVGSEKGVALDFKNLYVTDTSGVVYAYDKDSGASVWKNDKLKYRDVSGPAVLGRYVSVADSEGYLHVLSRDNGQIIGRQQLDGSAVVAQPLVKDETFIVQTVNGNVYGLGIR
ncbi:outer membrane protein assembly factor BamB [Leeia sp. TBRC 13508]|uniref:Outer membrane protein assembly factor BamB n=1 Tax=Leeia speluncae TaxID=2884804 RepID=A0ABS8DBH3_9NEIS|nr:outer membrane protein assembly factor BamB [Leeia speluncae]MCB6185276.1 outer membrane protein assembly factor BamB [Leeia speluncae]